MIVAVVSVSYHCQQESQITWKKMYQDEGMTVTTMVEKGEEGM